MQAHADALPRPLDLAGKERSRQPLVRSGRRGDGEFDRREIRRDAAVTYDPAGIVVVASGWLAFYVAAVIHLL
jgi:hypothetical protein